MRPWTDRRRSREKARAMFGEDLAEIGWTLIGMTNAAKLEDVLTTEEVKKLFRMAKSIKLLGNKLAGREVPAALYRSSGP